jgi:hypothetical protein
MNCAECSGSGACDACDGYGTEPVTHCPDTEAPECDVCSGDGICVACRGARLQVSA